jgi:uncharacterized repeat protein (TIGR03803 family)
MATRTKKVATFTRTKTANQPFTSFNSFLRFAAVLALTLSSAAAFAASSEIVIHQFNGPDGTDPAGGLLIDADGNLYGTAQNGGSGTACLNGCGVVFKLTPIGNGHFKYYVIHNFLSGQDGALPQTTLIMDAAGNLYGTTTQGGDGGLNTSCFNGCGTVFMLSPSNGRWSETVLHRFQGSVDGRTPVDSVAMDGAGNLYGVTEFSDNSTPYIGEVFELSPGGDRWIFKTLHNFLPSSDGYFPLSGVVLDQAGNLYGNTQFGGNAAGCYKQGCGVVYELSPATSGDWTETILYEFPNLAGDPGSIPSGRVVLDSAGDIYGTAKYGGDATSNCTVQGGCGTVFKLSNVGGTWQRTTLHFFGRDLGDGINPFGRLTLDAAGNVYGTTQYGGVNTNRGIVYKLSSHPDGSYTYNPLHSFTFTTRGSIPWAGVTPDPSGNLWGTTYYGGNIQQNSGDGYGVVFELTAGGGEKEE